MMTLMHKRESISIGLREDVAVKGQRVFGIICLNDPTKDLIEKSRLTIRCGYLSTPFPIQRLLSNEEGMYPARPSDQLDNLVPLE